MTWRFCVTHEEPELLTDIREFSTQFYVILRRMFSEWLELSIKSDLGMRFAIWSLDLTIVILLPSYTVSNVRAGLQKEYFAFLFLWFGKRKCFYPWTVILYFLGSWTMPETPLYDPLHCQGPSNIILACLFGYAFNIDRAS